MSNSETGTATPSDNQAAELPVLLQGLRALMALLGHTLSSEALVAGIPVGGAVSQQQVLRICSAHGFNASWQKRALDKLPALLLPCLVLRSDGGAAVVLRIGADTVTAIVPEMGETSVELSRDTFASELTGEVLLLKREGVRSTADDRSGIDALVGEGHWFWKVIAHFKGYYVEAGITAVLVNVLSLASIFFTMNVYDRVISNQAYTTLWTLAFGVVVALVFEYALRNLRAWLLDSAGKKADLLLGSSLFAKVLATRLDARPQSAGAFANMLKEYESLRDFATSTVLVAISDLPFLLLFLFVLYVIAGPLVMVPLAAALLVVIAGALVQIPLARLVGQNLRESSVRHGVLVEAVEGSETIKALRAEGLVQGRYEKASAITALTANRSRILSGAVANFQYITNTLCTVGLVVWGVYLIGDGALTMGSLIGSVMLSSRALAPLGALNALAIRLQQARSSYSTLNDIMKRPSDREPGRIYAVRPMRSVDLVAKDLRFSYGPNAPLVIRDLGCGIKRGEKLAILGRVGSGKTTLLKLLAGLYAPASGLVTVDGVDLRQVDPAEYRGKVMYVGQHANLFYGTLRDNLKMGAPFASDEAMITAATAVGVHAFAQQHPMGYDLVVAEHGENLSGGQRQAIALARALLVEPDVMLLDEPTSAMDASTETLAMQSLLARSTNKTLVLVTHRLQLLEYVQRVMVMDQGVRVADGPRDEVMRALKEGRLKQVDPSGPRIKARPPGSPPPPPTATEGDAT